MECFATTLKNHHNLLVAIVGPRHKQTNDGCTVETLESQMVKKYMWYYHYARGKRRAEFSMPDDQFFKTEPREEMDAICYYALLDRDVEQIVALNTRRVADMFDYMTSHRDELLAKLRKTDSKRADEVESAFQSELPLAKALWSKLERIVAFGLGDCSGATARMKLFTGDTPHNNGYYYTEETICGKAVADDSNLFESFLSNSFHEFLPLKKDNADTVLSTETKPGVSYYLVVTNSAGLYRYVTDHIICIQEKQMDIKSCMQEKQMGKILFTIY
jgi:hypothetical protein